MTSVLTNALLTEMKLMVLLKIVLKKVKKDVIIVCMRSKAIVVKSKAELRPIPETIRRIFGTVETPPVLPDKQPETQKNISHRARKELLGLTKELRKIDPKSKKVDYEQRDGFKLYLYGLRGNAKRRKGC